MKLKIVKPQVPNFSEPNRIIHMARRGPPDAGKKWRSIKFAIISIISSSSGNQNYPVWRNVE